MMDLSAQILVVDLPHTPHRLVAEWWQRYCLNVVLNLLVDSWLLRWCSIPQETSRSNAGQILPSWFLRVQVRAILRRLASRFRSLHLRRSLHGQRTRRLSLNLTLLDWLCYDTREEVYKRHYVRSN